VKVATDTERVNPQFFTGQGSRGSCREAEAVADTEFGEDEGGMFGIGFDFIAEMADVNAQVVGVLIVTRPPNLTEDVAVRQHHAGVADKQAEEVVLDDRKFEFPATASDAPSGEVHGQVAGLEGGWG
jgi:hypothetical protein